MSAVKRRPRAPRTPRTLRSDAGRASGPPRHPTAQSRTPPREDVVAKTAYVLANPVAAGLVRAGHEWPGLRTAPEQLGGAKLTALRPKVFFRSAGDMPAFAELTLSVPPGFGSAKEFQDRVAHATTQLEARHRSEIADGGRSFLGRVRVLAQSPFARPRPGEPRRVLNPRVAARDKWKRIEALTRLTGFLRAYREALAALRAKVTDVVFPPGTYKLRVEHGVPCAASA